jgi:predicted nuclease of predicted toxin-antitoxin system
MTILLDTGVPRRYLRLLIDWGYPAELSSAHIPRDAPDPHIIALAGRLNAALLTVDLDFANILDSPPSQHDGIIVLRYRPEDESELDAALKVMLGDLYNDGLKGLLIIVSPSRYRVRR